MGIKNLKECAVSLALAAAFWPSFAGAAAAESVQTIVFIRHAEKPAQGLGMLNCQGLNRALALPAVLLAKFGKFDAVFAPDPHEKKPDGEDSQLYNYLRPLLTVAPLAAQLGLPINTAFGYADSAGLQQELALPKYHNAVLLVGWEHHQLEGIVKSMLSQMGGQAGNVPDWKSRDFDSIYILTVHRSGAAMRADFALAQQRLDGQSKNCPGSGPR